MTWSGITAEKETREPPAGKNNAAGRKKPHHNLDLILDAWAAGESSTFIAQRVGSSAGYIRTLVKKAREQADPRAVLGGPLQKQAKGHRQLDHEAILDRWQQGWRADELARFADTTPETIYDLLMAHRRRGDPRAVRRRKKNGEAGRG